MKFCQRVLVFIAFLWAAPLWAQVAFTGTPSLSSFGSGTSTTNTGVTVSGSNTCLIGVLVTFSNTISAPSMHWDSTGTNQAMTSIGSIGNAGTGRIDVFLLINPTAGNKTLASSWTTADSGEIGAFNFSGADQSTCYKVADNVSETAGAPANCTVTSTTTGATFCVLVDISTITATTTQTEIWRISGGSAASYGLGGTSNTHSWTTTGSHSFLGFHVLAAAGGGGTKSPIIGGGFF